MKRKLMHRYQKLCPYGEERLSQMVRTDIRKIMVCSVAAVVALLVWNVLLPGGSVVYVLGLIGFTVSMLFRELSDGRVRKTEDVFLKELIGYLSAVKHTYLSGKTVSNAVWSAAEEFGEEIRLHAVLLYRILSRGERREQVREYVVFSKYSRFLKLFLVQAYEASEKGDTYFTENLEHLRLIVMEELYHERKKGYEYAGFLFVSVTPVFFLPLLRQWGISFSPGLEDFYGGIGKVIEVLAVLVTYVVYLFIRMAKGISSFGEEPAAILFPRLLGWYEKQVFKEEAEHEIRQFQTVILMERRMEDATIPELLEDMEIFSRLFRQELRMCINTYATGPKKALHRLREEGGNIHAAFRELADGFLAVDEVGISRAFAEVGNNRERLEKMSRLEAEIRLERRRDGMDLLSKLPLVIALGMYFIVPFFVESVQGVYEVFFILSELQR